MQALLPLLLFFVLLTPTTPLFPLFSSASQPGRLIDQPRYCHPGHAPIYTLRNLDTNLIQLYFDHRPVREVSWSHKLACHARDGYTHNKNQDKDKNNNESIEYFIFVYQFDTSIKGTSNYLYHVNNNQITQIPWPELAHKPIYNVVMSSQLIGFQSSEYMDNRYIFYNQSELNKVDYELKWEEVGTPGVMAVDCWQNPVQVRMDGARVELVVFLGRGGEGEGEAKIEKIGFGVTGQSLVVKWRDVSNCAGAQPETVFRMQSKDFVTDGNIYKDVKIYYNYSPKQHNPSPSAYTDTAAPEQPASSHPQPVDFSIEPATTLPATQQYLQCGDRTFIIDYNLSCIRQGQQCVINDGNEHVLCGQDPQTKLVEIVQLRTIDGGNMNQFKVYREQEKKGGRGWRWVVAGVVGVVLVLVAVGVGLGVWKRKKGWTWGQVLCCRCLSKRGQTTEAQIVQPLQEYDEIRTQ